MVSDSAIVEDYALSLNELTFNSRPIIENLTTIAQENTNVADGIMNAITTRILKCIPEHKLFALYLLDSVCKYGGEPYNILVGDDIFKLFSHVFMLVNEQTRQKLIKIFEIWKITKSKGSDSPLFPKSQLDKIQNFLNQAGYSNNTNNLTKISLIDDINTLIPIFQKKLVHSNDPKLKDRFKALNQLRDLLISQPMRANELQAVQQQLNAIKQQELNNNTIVPSSVAAPSPVHLPPIPPKPVSNKANEVFPILIASGLVKVDQSLIAGSRPTYELVFPKVKFEPPSNQLPSTNDLQDILVNSTLINNGIPRSAYEQSKVEELAKIQVQSSKDLQSFVSNNVPASSLSLLYDKKPSKCGICGKRFTTDEMGATRKRLHLDWHFRVNKKLSSNSSNVQARNWYLDDYDWVKFKDENLLEYSTTVSKNTGQDSIAKQTENSPRPYVIVSSSETNMVNQCQICREQVKATYNDELGEWCWLDCIRAPGENKNSRKIFHASCFNEANRKRSADNDLHSSLKREKT
ncbi:uncharacterized protein PRCAT00002839001 [Priceomyces carsonii]|uniref:uncharacterized protein n=1 Tax=Priceomyces carsonii TaxID=28549 RepID=UPI002ED9644E|nr:unnamed protein product [Priceomyces carsonii]